MVVEQMVRAIRITHTMLWSNLMILRRFSHFHIRLEKKSETTNGNIKGYKLYASTEAEKLDFNSDKWGEPIAEGEFEYDGHQTDLVWT